MSATRTVTLTHKGWFGLCPVYVAGPDTACPDVHERHWACAPLMWISLAVFGLCFAAMEFIDPLHVPEWPLKLTGKLARPRTVVLPALDQR